MNITFRMWKTTMGEFWHARRRPLDHRRPIMKSTKAMKAIIKPLRSGIFSWSSVIPFKILRQCTKKFWFYTVALLIISCMSYCKNLHSALLQIALSFLHWTTCPPMHICEFDEFYWGWNGSAVLAERLAVRLTQILCNTLCRNRMESPTKLTVKVCLSETRKQNIGCRPFGLRVTQHSQTSIYSKCDGRQSNESG